MLYFKMAKINFQHYTFCIFKKGTVLKSKLFLEKTLNFCGGKPHIFSQNLILQQFNFMLLLLVIYFALK